MKSLVMDDTTATQLSGAAEFMEFRDANGRVLGHFIPAVRDSNAAHMTVAEIEILKKQTGGRTLREIWQVLGRLA